MNEPEIPGTAITPPLGPDRATRYQTCGYDPSLAGTAECGKPTTHHIIWTLDGENGAACDEHFAEAKQRWAFVCAHKVGADCFMPNSRVSFEENVCVVEGEPIGGPVLEESRALDERVDA